MIPRNGALQASLSFTISWSLFKLTATESRMPSKHLVLCHPVLLLHSIFFSIRVFPNELVLPIRWSKHWSFSISPFNEYSGLISFTIDWFDLLAVQGTLKCLLQHHSLKASILQHSASSGSFRQIREVPSLSLVGGAQMVLPAGVKQPANCLLGFEVLEAWCHSLTPVSAQTLCPEDGD